MPTGESHEKTTTVVTTIVITIVAIIALLIVGFLVMDNRNKDSDLGAAAGEFQKAPPTSTNRPTPVERPAYTPTPAPTLSTREEAPASGDDRLSDGGWDGTYGHCNANDEWVYAGQGDGDFVVVCRVGAQGDYYYRGDVGGMGLERDVDMSRTNEANGQFSIPADDQTRIELNGNSLTVVENGVEVSSGAFEEFHTR